MMLFLSSSKKGLNGDSNPDLCVAGGVLHQLRYYKPVDLEIDDDNRGIFHVFELRIGMNEFDCSFLSLRKQQREGFSECSASCIVASYTFCNESIN